MAHAVPEKNQYQPNQKMENVNNYTTAQLRELARTNKAGQPDLWPESGSQIVMLKKDELTEMLTTRHPEKYEAVEKKSLPFIKKSIDPKDKLAEALAELAAGQPAGVDEDAVNAAVESAIKPLQDKVASLEDATGAVKALVEVIKTDAKAAARLPVVLAAASGSNPVLQKVSPLYKPGIESGTHSLVLSPPSFGKSYSIRQLGKSYDLYLEHGCSNDMDEIATLLGSPVPDGKGGFAISDGVLSQAVRAASTGKSVLLLLDEILRLPETVQEWFLTFLTGHKTDDGLEYRLRTRHMLPDGNLEVITCKAANLHIIAAANLGPANPIEALWSRFQKVRIEWTESQAASTAQAIAASYDISDAHGLAISFAAAMKKGRAACADGSIQFPVDFRMLERACKHSKDATRESVCEYIKDRLADEIACWHPDTGDMLPDSISACDSIASLLA